MTKVPTPFVTREAWLQALVEKVTPWYEDLGLTVPPVRCSVGFSSKGVRSNTIGECWHGVSVTDGIPAVFIHPKLATAEDVGHVVIHELVHAALGPGAKHGPLFKRPATALGLAGRMTATVPTPELCSRLVPVFHDLGPYPHAALVPSGLTSTGPKQTTRMLKCECLVCGYTARTTRKWLDEVGAPWCPVHGEMYAG
jgi:hypothetical protein